MKFCFWGNVAAALKDQTPGGGELQIALLAKALALKGHEVVIVDPYAKENFLTKEGVKLINVPDWNKGLHGLRLFFRRIPALKKILIEQKADYYYVRMRSYLHLVSYLACKKVKAKFIVAIAHDLDLLNFGKKFIYSYRTKFNLFSFLTLYLPNDWVFRYLLKKADHVILQHVGQKLNFKKRRGEITVFPNIFDQANLPPIQNPSKDYYIHAGTLTVLKGSLNLYRLLQSMNKNIPVVIVGDYYDKKSERVYKKLQRMENVVVKGRQDHKETIRLIANAKALINTSNFEGFPNIFLEAWGAGVPVISLKINPGNVFDKFHLGVFCKSDLDKMKECIESNGSLQADKEAMTSYVSEFHSFATAADRFLSIIKKP